MDPCYELIRDHVSAEDWLLFSNRLAHGFKGFPPAWGLPDAIRERLILKLQWHFFNPDLVEGEAEKRVRTWAYLTSFLSEAFQRKFNFLRSRLDPGQMDRWDRKLADFETLLLVSSMTEEEQLEWLAGYEAKIRHGRFGRARVIKNKGLGLQSRLLGVDVLMDWTAIKTRYRYMLKKSHPDLGGDAEITRAVVAEFARLQAEKERAEKNPARPKPQPDWLRGD